MLTLSQAKVCLIVFSTNRPAYLAQCLTSWHQHVELGQVQVYKILVDDLPTGRDDEVIQKLAIDYQFDQVILNKTNLGLDQNMLNIWRLVPADCQYVWHHEDDHLFQRPVRLDDLLICLEECPLDGFRTTDSINQPTNKIQEIGFHRADYYGSDNHCAKMKQLTHLSWPSKIDQSFTYRTAVEPMTLRFYFGSTLYRREIIELDYSQFLPQEGTIFDALKRKYPQMSHWKATARVCGPASWSSELEPPQTKHIGEYSLGFPLSPDMPGWDTWVGRGKWSVAQKGKATCSLTGRTIPDQELKQISQVSGLPSFQKEEELLAIEQKQNQDIKNKKDKKTVHWLINQYESQLALISDLTPEQEYYIYLQLATYYQQLKKHPELIKTCYQWALTLLPNRVEGHEKKAVYLRSLTTKVT